MGRNFNFAKKKHFMTGLVIIAFVLFYGMGFFAYFYTNIGYAIDRSRDKLYAGPIDIGDRILIIAPHPDDENVGMGGLIYNETRLGKKIKVVVVTNGDGFKRAVKNNIKPKNIEPEDYIKLGLMRQKETISAMRQLGLSKDDIIFLGYADGSIRDLWEENWDYDNPHMSRNGNTKTPYDNSFDKNAIYCGKNLVKNLRQIIDDFKPTDIFYPDPDDMHPDHWAVSNFVKFTVELYDYKAHMYSYLVHHYQWPEPWALLPAAALYPPLSLQNVGTRWHIYRINPEAEKAKEKAVREYRTQFKIMGTFLDAFVRRNELFGTYENKYYKKTGEVPDFKKGRGLPYKVVTASIMDNPLLRVEGNDDIKAIGFVRAQDQYFFAIETRGNVEKKTDYILNAIFIYKNRDIKRLKVFIRNFKATSISENDESIALKQPVPVSVYKKRIWFSIPEDYIGDPQKVFLNAITSTAGRYVDKTAWRVVKPESQGEGK
ncbi:PIG-L family deacetylase [Thermoanaerobacteraceae bacterium SP2]|nr:PIG-L family deacetylase [Thermoanaerobacteraceae bacterium SP2]